MADDNPYGLSQQDISDLQDVRSHIPKGDPRGVKIDILLGGVTKPQPPSPVANQAFIQARNSMPSAPNPILANQPQTAGGQLGDEIGNFTTATNAKVAGMIGGIPDALKSVFAAPNVQEFVKQQAVNGIVNYIKDAAKAQKSGTPVTPAPLFVGASAMGLDPSAIREAALNKDLPSIAGEGAGTLAMILGANRLGQKVPAAADAVDRFSAAEGNPNSLYHKYLDPVSDVKQALPDMTPRIKNALINRTDINYPEVAARMKAGTTTIGDLDVIRQVANDAAKAAYTARGIPTQLSQGFRNAASSVRDVIYPKIEELHGLPDGSLSAIKEIQGQLIGMGPPPKIGYLPSRYPTVALDRLVKRPGIQAIQQLRTKAIASGLPEAKQ